MSKKHFIALAQALHYRRPEDHWDANKRVQWELDVNAIADVCARFNGAFDRGRFISACNGE
jgi:hypothetical protein